LSLVIRFPPFMNAFRKHGTDAAYIGRIIAGYGGIEFRVGESIGNALASKRKPTPKNIWLLQHDTHYRKIGLQVLFKIQGAERRLKRAKAIARLSYERAGLGTEFSETLLDINQCRILRNIFAHAVYDHSSTGLFISSMEQAASHPGMLRYEIQNVPRQSLKEIEAFFKRTERRIFSMNYIFAVRAGLSPPPAPSMPKRPAALRAHTSLLPFHIQR
jgi:hypothetical protein